MDIPQLNAALKIKQNISVSEAAKRDELQMNIAFAKKVRRSVRLWGLSLLGCLFLSPCFAEPAKHQIDIPSGPAEASLVDLVMQAHVQILFDSDAVRGRRTKRVAGRLDVREAISRMLVGTNLDYEFVNEHTVAVKVGSDRKTTSEKAIRYAAADDIPSDDSAVNHEDSASLDSKTHLGREGLEEVVVTGSHIRGAQSDSSPVVVYNREEIERTGVATLSDFARQMPQNFAAASPGTQYLGSGGTIDAGQNFYSGAAFNLHGLGVGATLTLINGHRITGGGQEGEFVDISMIPLSAIDRIEVLQDGASAVYGADAVAGVVNIILRKDFDGTESSFRYGDSARGGADQVDGSQLLGQSWGSGSAMLIYNFNRQNLLDASERSFIPDAGGPLAIIPEKKVNSVLLNASQKISDFTSVSANTFFSKSDFAQDTTIGSVFHTVGDTKLYGGAVGVDQKLLGDWHALISGTYSKLDQQYLQNFAAYALSATSITNTSLGSLELNVDGSLFPLPSGDVRAAAGGSFRSEQTRSGFGDVFDGATLASEDDRLRRNIGSVYGEILLPLAGGSYVLPGIDRVELSLAVRTDHYSDFGSSTNPKVGVLWSPTAGLNLRGTYGSSFHPPLLTSLAPNFVVSEQQVPNSASPSGSTVTLINGSNNPQLKPEKSHSFTAGVDWTSKAIPGASIELTYFQIRFKERISSPPVIGALSLDQPQLAAFIENPASSAAIQAITSQGQVIDQTGLGPDAIQAIYDGRPQNIAVSKESGVDLSGHYRVSTNIGDFTSFFGAEYLLDNSYQVAAGGPIFGLVNVLNEPVKLRMHYGLNWALRHFATSLTINTQGSYKNPTVIPTQKVDALTTADVQFSYRFQPSFAREFTIALNVLNLGNSNPPSVSYPVGSSVNLGYDPLNSSPLGRLIALQVTAAF